jgi:hypothetical protein
MNECGGDSVVNLLVGHKLCQLSVVITSYIIHSPSVMLATWPLRVGRRDLTRVRPRVPQATSLSSVLIEGT